MRSALPSTDPVGSVALAMEDSSRLAILPNPRLAQPAVTRNLKPAPTTFARRPAEAGPTHGPSAIVATMQGVGPGPVHRGRHRVRPGTRGTRAQDLTRTLPDCTTIPTRAFPARHRARCPNLPPKQQPPFSHARARAYNTMPRNPDVSDPIARWHTRHAEPLIRCRPNNATDIPRSPHTHKQHMRLVTDVAHLRRHAAQHNAPPP